MGRLPPAKKPPVLHPAHIQKSLNSSCFLIENRIEKEKITTSMFDKKFTIIKMKASLDCIETLSLRHLQVEIVNNYNFI